MQMNEAPRSRRDARIDVVRSLALLTIFINHIPGTVFEHLTLKNYGFADAAEVFVLVSGMAVGLAYGPRLAAGARLLPTLRMWKRAGVLYCAHIMTTVATLTIFCGAAILASRPDLLRLNNIHTLFDDPEKAFVGIGLLGHQLGYNNILSMYAILMLAAPLMLLALLRWFWPTLIVSGAIWLAAGLWQIAPPNYPTEGFWFLNPLSWQFLFAIGIAGVLHARRGGRIPAWLTPLSALYLIGALILVYSPAWGHERWFGLPAVIGGFDKTFLSLSRLLDILALACLVANSRWLTRLSESALGRGLALLGRHSLPVFITGTILAMIGQALRAVLIPSFPLDCLLIGGGIALQFLLVIYLEWLARQGRQPRPAPAIPSAAVAAG